MKTDHSLFLCLTFDPPKRTVMRSLQSGQIRLSPVINLQLGNQVGWFWCFSLIRNSRMMSAEPDEVKMEAGGRRRRCEETDEETGIADVLQRR